MRFGATILPGGGVRFAVHAAGPPMLCLFDGTREERVAMARADDGWVAIVAAAGEGTRYGYRMAGDPAKLLVDPYAVEIDAPFHWSADLATPGADTTAIVPKGVVRPPVTPTTSVTPAKAGVSLHARDTHDEGDPSFRWDDEGGWDDRGGWDDEGRRDAKPRVRLPPGALIYEANVRALTMLHPDVPQEQRGTIAALAHPAVIAHLTRIGVDAIELMPVAAWIDERHLPPLGLRNAWGYNPVTMMALDPRLAPGGMADLRAAVAALHAAGIAVILDVVFNHSGESDARGGTLSMRGLDAGAYYAHAPDGTLINDTGTGNTLRTGHPIVRDLILDSLRHFARAGVDGFRFDLAPVLARDPGFDAHAPIFAAIAADPWLRDRIMIAEPWDIGPGGYQLGAFPPGWLEWNDRYRDDARRFWRGDGAAGAFATRLCGSPDIFGEVRTRTVNFIAAHDGFALADIVAYADRHNAANGEQNRDGHADNQSWNNGAEGETADPAILARRDADVAALLLTLAASRGVIQITAGDEFGRTQHGNNNAYAQDNALTWLDWAGRDQTREALFAAAIAWRRAHRAVGDPAMRHDPRWWSLDGAPMTAAAWEDAACPGFTLEIPTPAGAIRLRFDRANRSVRLDGPSLPAVAAP